VITLKPGESWSISTGWKGVQGEDGKVRIEMAYETGPEFAARHRTWAGRVEAKPVVIEVKEHPGSFQVRAPGNAQEHLPGWTQ
jgi:hypothetical protein